MDKQILDNLATKLADAVPDDFNSLRDDLRGNFHAVLQTALGNLDLVSREEFDVLKARLDAALAEIETLKNAQKMPKKPTRKPAAKRKA